jgi:hypothetical protein
MAIQKVTKAAIASVEKLLKSIPPEQIIKENPELHRPLMHFLFKVNTCAAIADLFTSCDRKMSRQHVHQILQETPHLAIKTVRTKKASPRPLSPEQELEIVNLFKDGMALTAIREQCHTSVDRVHEALAKHGYSLRDRRQSLRKVRIGDRFGNWKVVSYHSRNQCLCRDVRNGVEKAVRDQALVLGTSTGCRELAIVGRGASDRKAIADLKR